MKSIDVKFLRKISQGSRNISLVRLAKGLNIHRNTLSRKLREIGIQRKYSEITDEDLDATIRAYRLQRPDAGLSYVTSELRSQNIRVQRWRICEAVRRVDGVGVQLRARKHIARRAYTNPRPMAVWHCDGHLKGVLWGVILHGFIDGFSRKVS